MLPDGALRALTWSVMGVELLFAPLALIRRARPWLWGTMLTAQVGFLCLLNFADLTAAMLLFHMLTFDPRWIAAKARERRIVIFYDGHCGLCHRVVRFVLAEDKSNTIMFSPLQGSTIRRMIADDARWQLPDSFVVLDDMGRLFLRSDAAIYVATCLGGWWRVIAAIVPRPLRDGGYRLVAAVRHRLFERPTQACPVVPAALRARFRQ